MSLNTGSLLTIDAGNTRTKWALFNAVGELLNQGVCANANLAMVEFLPKSTLCKYVVIANVAGEKVAQMLTEKCVALGLTITWARASHLACSVKNNYDNPSQLGVDRWAAIIAAWYYYQSPCVMVNVGTAVTIDALASNKEGAEFLGGLILPGLNLMQQNLVQGTHDIASGVVNQIGKAANFPTNTADAVVTGACLAIVGAIAEMVEKLQASCEQVMIILSGGDARILIPLLAQKFNTDSLKRVVLHDNLVLQGLYLLEREQE